MRIIISVLFLLFLQIQTSAKQKLIISINMNECVNCYNALSALKHMDTSLSMVYILPEQYSIDSVELKEYLSLPEHGLYVWSDTLNKKYLINGQFSSITFVQENDVLAFSVKEELDRELVRYFNSLLQSEYVYTFDKNIFKASNSDLKYYKNYLFISNKLTNNITKANLINGATEEIIKYTDERINQAYDLESKDKEFIFGIGLDYDIKNLYSIESFDVYKDKIYVLSKYLDYEFGSDFKDTFQIYFLSLQVFDFHGKLLNTYSVESQVKDKVSNQEMFFTNSVVFKVENETTFHIGLSHYKENPDVNTEGYFIAKYFLNNKNQTVKFVQPWPFLLGDKYQFIGYNYSYSFFSYDGQASVNVLNDSVYLYNHQNFSSYGMGLFENKTSITEENLHEVKEYNRGVAITDSFVYVSYVIDYILKYAKIDLKSEKKIIKDVFNYLEVNPIEYYTFIDYLNSDYLMSPVAPNKIKRYQLF